MIECKNTVKFTTGITSLLVWEPGVLLAGSHDGQIRKLNILTSNQTENLEEFSAGKHNGAIWSFAANFESKELFSGGADSDIHVFHEKEHGFEYQETRKLCGHHGKVYSLLNDASGHLYSGSSDSTIKVWRVENGECLMTWSEHTVRISIAITFLSN